MLGVTLMLVLGVTLMLGVTLGVAENDGFGVVVIVTDGVVLTTGVPVMLMLGVILGLDVTLVVTLGVIVTVVDIVGVIVTLGVELGVRLGVTEGDPAINDLVTAKGSQISLFTIFTLDAEKGISTTIPETRSFTSTLEATKFISS